MLSSLCWVLSNSLSSVIYQYLSLIEVHMERFSLSINVHRKALELRAQGLKTVAILESQNS